MRTLFAVLSLSTGLGSGGAAAAPPLRLVQAIPLDGVEGRIDHLAADTKGQRLFVAALGNGTVEVVDLRSGRRSRRLRGFHEPQGLGFVASPPRLFVANGADGTCEVLHGETFTHLRTLRFVVRRDADRRIVDRRRRLWQRSARGPRRGNGRQSGRYRASAHPESFQLESAGSRVFVNVPDTREVVLIERARGRSVTQWHIEDFAANYPMALDEAGHRLFIGCRHPAAVLVLDDRSGRRLAAVPIDGDVDDLFYDAETGRVLASCGAGFIDVLGVTRPGRLAVIARLATARGARTGLYVPGLRRFYLAIPHGGTQRAEIRVFAVSQ